MTSPTGLLLERALSSDFALEKGFLHTLDDIPADEFNVLRILQAEKNRYEREQLDKDKANATRPTQTRH